MVRLTVRANNDHIVCVWPKWRSKKKMKKKKEIYNKEQNGLIQQTTSMAFNSNWPPRSKRVE